MKWVTWEQSVTALALCSVFVIVAGRLPRNRLTTFLIPAARELGFISGIYAIWRLARQLPFKKEEDALRYARAIHRLQQWLHFPSELSLQEFVVDHDRVAWLTAFYYRTFHVPTLLIFLVWLFFRHREQYWKWRTGLSFMTAGCLWIRFIRVAPPRFLPELGFVDLSNKYGMSFYGKVGTGVSDQFAAMPSIHIAWAAVVALGVFFVSPSRWRWVIVMHLPITFFVVAATGHHWWADGIVAIALLGLGLWIDTVARRRWPRNTSQIGHVAHLMGGKSTSEGSGVESFASDSTTSAQLAATLDR